MSPSNALQGKAGSTPTNLKKGVTLPSEDSLRTNRQIVKRLRLLARANERLTRAQEIQNTWLAHVSHEMRTPLTVVSATLGGLLDGVFGALNDQQSRWLNTLTEQVARLTNFLNELLDLAKLEDGSHRERPEPVELKEFCRQVVDDFHPLMARAGLRLETDFGVDPVTVRAVRRQLGQVIVNLLGNAIKFTPAGGHISFQLLKKEERAFFIVQDSGIGLSPEDQKKIFEKYVQGQQSSKGVGLGLAICREIVEQHHGTIAVESALGHGSRFIVGLPLGEWGHKVPRVLLLVGSLVAADLRTRLTRRGIPVTRLEIDPSATDALREDARRYHLAVIDADAAGGLGLQLLKDMRRYHPETPVIFLTHRPEGEFFRRVDGGNTVFVVPKDLGVTRLWEWIEEILKDLP